MAQNFPGPAIDAFTLCLIVHDCGQPVHPAAFPTASSSGLVYSLTDKNRARRGLDWYKAGPPSSASSCWAATGAASTWCSSDGTRRAAWPVGLMLAIMGSAASWATALFGRSGPIYRPNRSASNVNAIWGWRAGLVAGAIFCSRLGGPRRRSAGPRERPMVDGRWASRAAVRGGVRPVRPRVYRAPPGRVNLIGEHTDYKRTGFVIADGASKPDRRWVAAAGA